MKYENLVVICGGFSQEREVSLNSGNNVFNALIELGYHNTKLVDIKSADDLEQIIQLKRHNAIDLAVLMTHGSYGEDGRLQGFLEMLGIAYTGSNSKTSAICMDKILTKKILAGAGLPVLRSYTPTNILVMDENMERPMILKPVSEGSSFGVKKFHDIYELQDYIKVNDTQNFFIEDFIHGTEITASIIEKPEITSLPLLELKPKNEFYDHEAKYTAGMTEFIVPANINEQLEAELQDLAFNSFLELNCKTAARIDFIIDQNNRPYILEVNTLPGMTNTSDLPAQAQAAGISYNQLVEYLVTSCKVHQTF